MVSWWLHSRLGDAICSFHSREIDTLIDSVRNHDISRYDVKELLNTVRIVKARYGDRGLCYFVFHHYLDRLVDILVSVLSNHYERYALGHEALNYDTIRKEIAARLYNDPKNVLSLLVSNLNNVRVVLYLMNDRESEKVRRSIGKSLSRASGG